MDDVFSQCRQEMDDFIKSMDKEGDPHVYYKSMTGRLFVPYSDKNQEDTATLLQTSLSYYEEIQKTSDYDVSHILHTLRLLIHLNSLHI